MEKIKILFITPYFNSGGSEVYLKYLIENLDLSRFDFQIISDKPFVGVADLEKYKGKIHINKFNYSKNKDRENKYSKLIFNVDQEFVFFKKVVNDFKPDLCYINTIVISKYSRFSSKLKVPYFLHVHELPSVYERIKSSDFDFSINNAKSVICCSTVVANAIKNVRTKDIYIQHEHIRSHEISGGIDVKNMRIKHNIPVNGFIWMMSGFKSHRKGYDLVIEICDKIKAHNGYLLWVGGSFDNGLDFLVKNNMPENLIELNNLDYDDYIELFQIVDGFALTSREDPFPLVMIEAASFGLPIVSFNSGGISEFMLPHMGSIVHLGNIEEYTNTLIKYIENTIQFDKSVSINRAKEFFIEKKYKEWEKLMLELI